MPHSVYYYFIDICIRKVVMRKVFHLLVILWTLYPEIHGIENCIEKSIFKKTNTPTPFIYEKDIDDVIALIRDNLDTLVAMPQGTCLTPEIVDNQLAQFRTSLKNNNPLGNSFKAIEPNSVRTQVLRSKNHVVGFINYFMPADKTGHIEILCITKTRRNRGYGRRLVNYALEDLKEMNASEIHLVTGTRNVPAQNLYHSIGFNKLPQTQNDIFFNLIKFNYTRVK